MHMRWLVAQLLAWIARTDKEWASFYGDARSVSLFDALMDWGEVTR